MPIILRNWIEMRAFVSSMVLAVGVSLAGAAPSVAAGDAANGERLFQRQCTSCHVVRNDEGQVLAGRNARTGPNLFRIDGRAPATSAGYTYGASLTQYGETGVVWNEARFVEYVKKPTDFLRRYLDDSRARSRMAYYVREEQDSYDIWAYLQSIGQ